MNKVVLPEVPSRKGKNPSKLSLKPTNETEGIILSILDTLSEGEYLSQYLCRMLLSYSEKPFSERERIIFQNNYEFLKNACEHVKPITISTIWNTKAIHTVIPYRLATGREEMFNYLLCAEIDTSSGKQEAKAYRLNRVTRINYSMGKEKWRVGHHSPLPGMWSLKLQPYRSGKLMSLAMKPVSSPPFPLERIEEMTRLMGGDGELKW